MNIRNQKKGRTYISQGEFAIDGGPDAIIETLLGSCVSVCLWDPDRMIGGMNHVLFTDDTSNASTAYGHGVNSMELLINGLMRLGLDKSRFRAKVFGGSCMIDGLSDAGARNIAFAREYLEKERIVTIGGDTGGTFARRLEFRPGTGRARVKLVRKQIGVATQSEQTSSNVELF